MEVRERIIEEATTQFFKFGIRNVTMDDIAVSLGISKRTVYETFQNKSSLVETCLKKMEVLQDELTKKIISESANVIECIFAFMESGIKAIKAVNPVFFKDMEKFYPQVFKSIESESKIRKSELGIKLTKEGIENGLFRKNLNVELVSKIFQEQMNMLADENIFPRDKYDLSEVFKNMTINFTRGISTLKGIEIIDKMLT